MRHAERALCVRAALCGAALLCAILLATHDAVAQRRPVQWTLAPAPSLTLGLDDEDPVGLLQVVVFATRLADGAILVGDRGEFAIKRFSANGAFERAFARLGSGPGEVRYLGRMARCGDSLLTYDIEEGHRVSVFTLDGRYVRAFRFLTAPGQQVPYGWACNASGEFISVGWVHSVEMKPGVHRGMVPVWMGRADSTPIRMLDSVAGSERWGIVHEGRYRASRPLPLGKQPVVGIGRARAYVGSADAFVLTAYDLNGQPAGELRRPGEPEAVTREDIRDVIEIAVAEDGEPSRAGIERSYAEIAFPKTFPAYTALVVDAVDHAWVRGFPRSAQASVTWSVFAPTGALVAEVSVPKHLEVYEIGADYVLGRYLDPAEAVPQVRLYRLAR